MHTQKFFIRVQISLVGSIEQDCLNEFSIVRNIDLKTLKVLDNGYGVAIK